MLDDPGEIEGTGTHKLENFVDGTADLQFETLQASAKLIFRWPSSMRKPAAPTNKQEATGFVSPPRFDPKSSPLLFPGPGRGPQPVNPEPARPKAITRPG